MYDYVWPGIMPERFRHNRPSWTPSSQASLYSIAVLSSVCTAKFILLIGAQTMNHYDILIDETPHSSPGLITVDIRLPFRALLSAL